MGRYEIQVLDCYHNPDLCRTAPPPAIYGQHPPLVNACRPPGEWQTYDIIFNVPHFDADGNLLTPGYATVIHNGVVVQNHQAIRGDTNWRVPGNYTPRRPHRPDRPAIPQQFRGLPQYLGPPHCRWIMNLEPLQQSRIT